MIWLLIYIRQPYCKPLKNNLKFLAPKVFIVFQPTHTEDKSGKTVSPKFIHTRHIPIIMRQALSLAAIAFPDIM